ncbi:Cytochrome P450 18a1 [Hypsibius exemplaris]|uniref:Cytochrome P450 18a1 n=1 Tax=Hypsibius exemplaris TaxID=2072580 RepID=A0A1W0WQG0_HYPEX|nr:Cytochrome P450 18a1 [Hypsibius exemplaris]
MAIAMELMMAGAFVLTLLYLWKKIRRSTNSPPGPLAMPFFGNILSMGSRPELKILEWKAKYGDIFTMFNGRQRVVVLSDINTVRKVFNDDGTTGRLSDSAIRTAEAINLRGRFRLEETIIAEVEDLCRALRESDQEPVNPKVQIATGVANVTCALLFGKRFELDDPRFNRLTQMVAENIATFKLDFVAMHLPFLMWFPNFVRRKIVKAQENMRALLEFLREIIREHANTPSKQTESPDYLYAYQREAEAEKKVAGIASVFNELQLLGSLFDLFAAGTDTTTTTFLWALLFMVENPEIQKKVQQEIDEKTGGKNVLTTADRERLPYTEAVILEIQRCATIVPLGLPHRNDEDINVDGFIIPKGTLIAANLFSIHRDPRWWKNPEQFDPTRFLDENSHLIRQEAFVPFLIGKRKCPGEALAKMELFLFIANLLRCFALQLPPGRTFSRENYESSVINAPIPYDLIFIHRI